MNIRRSSPTLSEAEADALLSGRALGGHDDLREIIGLMVMASTVPVPTPNAALAAMLDTGFAPLPVDSAQRGSRWGRWGVRIGVATAAAMTVTFGAATANALPAPLQTAVANIVGALTPLQLPRPAARHDNGSTERGGASDDPADVRGPDSGADADTRTDAEIGTGESTAEPAEATPTAPTTAPPTPKAPATAPPPPKAPAVVAPPRRHGATATTPAEPDERDADEPDADEPDADEPDTDEPDTDEPDTDEPDTDEPDADEPDADEPDADEPDADEPSAEADQPEAPDADAG